jgi:hypothetical protein
MGEVISLMGRVPVHIDYMLIISSRKGTNNEEAHKNHCSACELFLHKRCKVVLKIHRTAYAETDICNHVLDWYHAKSNTFLDTLSGMMEPG